METVIFFLSLTLGSLAGLAVFLTWKHRMILAGRAGEGDEKHIELARRVGEQSKEKAFHIATVTYVALAPLARKIYIITVRLYANFVYRIREKRGKLLDFVSGKRMVKSNGKVSVYLSDLAEPKEKK